MTDRKLDTNVLLITPPKGLWRDRVVKPWNSTQPLGLAYIAASVRAAGYPVQVIDAYSQGFSGNELRGQIRSFAPRVVGISALTPQWPDAQEVAGIVKEIDRDILIVTGGPHVTALPEEVAGDPNVDVAVIGEGELAMRDICDAIAADTDLGQVAGIVLARNGKPEFTAPPAQHRAGQPGLSRLRPAAGAVLLQPVPQLGQEGSILLHHKRPRLPLQLFVL